MTSDVPQPIAQALSTLARTPPRTAAWTPPSAPPWGLWTVEIMARYQLMQLSGQMPTAARLDPENHRRDKVAAG
jgi:hypothetical protein